MVEIFCKRGELMEPDESIEQHATKRAEEIADVEKDKSSPEGLFKGTFRPSPRMELLFDEADGIFRCPTCQHEDEGGAFCENCGTFIERGDGYSDLDEDHDLDLEELELDADQEFAAHGHFHHFMGGLPQFPFGGGHMAFHPPHNHLWEAIPIAILIARTMRRDLYKILSNMTRLTMRLCTQTYPLPYRMTSPMKVVMLRPVEDVLEDSTAPEPFRRPRLLLLL